MKTKFSPEIVEELAKYVEEGNTNEDSAILSGVGESTFYEWLREKESDGSPNPNYHPELADALKNAETKCKRRNIAIIQRAGIGVKNEKGEYIEKPNWTAAAWWMERRYRDVYAIKQINQLENKNGETLKIEVVSGGYQIPGLEQVVPTSVSSNIPGTTAVQDTNLASESPQDNNGNNGTNTPGTS